MDTLTKLMTTLNISEEEAKQVMEDDKKIERGFDLFPLSPDQQKTAKKMARAGKMPTIYKFKTRSRKPNEKKKDLIKLFAATLESVTSPDLISISNDERQIDFEIDTIKYRIILSCPRK